MPNLPYYGMIWRRQRRRPCCPGWYDAQTVYGCMLYECVVAVVAPLLRLLVPAAYPSAAALHCAPNGTRYDSLLICAYTA